MSRYQKACNTVWRKGRDAAIAGLPSTACPYPDTRKVSGSVTWSRHWRKTWLIGYREERAKCSASK